MEKKTQLQALCKATNHTNALFFTRRKGGRKEKERHEEISFMIVSYFSWIYYGQGA